jgi:TetR/AcrR family transcriptional repressor of mexJK operon
MAAPGNASRSTSARTATPVRRLGRPPQVKAHDTRRRILDIARGVYAQRGYEAATNKEIADHALMTTAALYYHFPSKRDLYLAVHADAREQVYSRFEEVLDPTASFAEQLISILMATHELNEEDPTLAQFLAAARTDMKRRPDLIDALADRTNYRAQFFDRIIEAGVRSGEIREENRQLVQVFITAMITGMTDALSDDQDVHLRAIQAVQSILNSELVQPPSKSRRKRAS